MTITHHPSDETLTAFAAGTLDAGRSVVVAAHVALCPRCSSWTRMMEEMGGQHLAGLQATALKPGALEQALDRLDGAPPNSRLRRPAGANDTQTLPRSLGPYEIGPWRWIGPGLHWRSTSVPADRGARVFMLKAAPRTKLPHHTHTGTELTLVLAGAFTHQGGRFAAGDVEEADESVEHLPVVDEGEDCICLVAMEGQLRLLGVMGRILQPFVRL